MSVRLSTRWKTEQQDKINLFKRKGIDYEITLGVVPAIKWVTIQLVNEEIPFKTVKFGAGIVRITTKTDVCPKCGGLGRC